VVKSRYGTPVAERVGMAAPRPIKGILKNKNNETNVRPLPEEEVVPAEEQEQQPEEEAPKKGLLEDDQQ